MSTVKNTLNKSEQIIIELKHKLDVSGDTINTLKQPMKDLGDKEGSEPTEQHLHGEKCSTKKHPKFKCKYCEKSFFLTKLIEEHWYLLMFTNYDLYEYICTWL